MLLETVREKKTPVYRGRRSANMASICGRRVSGALPRASLQANVRQGGTRVRTKLVREGALEQG